MRENYSRDFASRGGTCFSRQMIHNAGTRRASGVRNVLSIGILVIDFVAPAASESKSKAKLLRRKSVLKHGDRYSIRLSEEYRFPHG